jgi:hypothetical protein
LFKVKSKKTIVEELKFQNHIEHWWKNPKHNPLHFETTNLVHFPLDYNVFYKFGYIMWRTIKLFEISKGIDHGQKSYNDPISLNVQW